MKLTRLLKFPRQFINIAAIPVIALLLLGAGFLLTPQTPTFINWTPNPYVLVAVAFSCYAGLTLAIVANVWLALQYILVLHFTTDYLEVETILSYHYFAVPITFVLLSFITALLQTRVKRRSRGFAQKVKEQEDIIASQLHKIGLLQEDTHKLKGQFISRLDTYVSTISRMQRFHRREEAEILAEFQLFLRELGVQRAGIVRFQGKERAATALDGNIDLVNHVLDPLFTEAVRLNKPFFLKDHVKSPEFATTQLLAVFPINVDGALFGALAIQEFNFLDHTSQNLLIIQSTLHWVEICLGHAQDLNKLHRNSILNADLQIHTPQYFADRMEEEHEFAKRYDKKVFIAKVEVAGIKQLPTLKKSYARRLVAQHLLSTMRKMDTVCEGDQEDNFYVILHLPEPSHAPLAQRRLADSMEHLMHTAGAKESLRSRTKLVEIGKEHPPEGLKELLRHV